MRGLGGVYKRGPVYWIRYHHRGREYRESSRSTDRADALALLHQRLADLSQGKPGGPTEERVTFADMAADYIAERALKGIPAARLQWSRARVEHLRMFFGPMRAIEISGDASKSRSASIPPPRPPHPRPQREGPQLSLDLGPVVASPRRRHHADDEPEAEPGVEPRGAVGGSGKHRRRQRSATRGARQPTGGACPRGPGRLSLRC
jgi:hypothetical protein